VIVGVVGGGQLGLMLAQAGDPLGVRCRFLDPSADAPAGRVGELIAGDYDDTAALARLADGAAAVTYEFENFPAEAAPAGVLPPPRALATSQDRLAEKELCRRLGLATAEFAPVDSQDDLDGAIERIGLPAVLKTRRLGYDGKGQAVLRDAAEVDTAWAELGGAGLILEELVPFSRELSVLAVRGRDGETAFYALAENTHRGGILRVSRAPAAPERQEEAARIAAALLDELDYVGVLAVELFETEAGLLVNELAPRVHNSGHWTIEGAATSQFENHLRAILGLPLGETAAIGTSVMVNLIGDAPPLERLLALPGARVHMYGKAPRPGRKLGHVTLVDPGDDDVASLCELAASAEQGQPAPAVQSIR
jgi:5-(carboxyamino)imidazole ribonucleotide synthase